MRHHPNSPIQPGGSTLWPILLIGVVVVVGIWGWRQYQEEGPQRAPAAEETAQARTPTPQANDRMDTVPNLLSLFSNDDYPAEAIRNGEQGTVAVRVAIGPDGNVTDCSITQSSGSDVLDSTTCTIIRERLKTKPAATVDGLSKITLIDQKVRWVIPSE